MTTTDTDGTRGQARGALVATLAPYPDCRPTRRAAWEHGTLPAKVKGAS